MNQKRITGIILIIISGFLIFSKFSITGAVIGTPIISYIPLIAIITFITGFVLLASLDELEIKKTARLKDLETAIQNAFPINEPDSIILDSSAMIDYGIPIGNDLKKYKDRVILSKRVIEELGKHSNGLAILSKFMEKESSNSEKLKFWTKKIGLKSKSVNSSDYKNARKISIKLLNKTRKHQDYTILRNALTNHPRHLEPFEQEVYDRVVAKAGSEITGREWETPSNSQLLNYLEKRYKFSKSDVEVLTSAVYKADKGETVAILAGDSHIREAAQNLRQSNPNIGNKIRVLNYK